MTEKNHFVDLVAISNEINQLFSKGMII